MRKKKANLLVLNDNAAPGPIQSLICNLLPRQCRFDTMEGREFIVVPMVILTEGVHAGSDGPLYYPAEELGKTPACWNHKPIVVYHPEMNGQGISACDPSVITNRKVGVMMNTKFEGGRLKSEAWLEKDRANLVDPRIMSAVERNEMMELSTGVFIDCEAAPGEWKGETYNAVARNYRPDHLALLPDKIGACSLKDGAGFLRNEAQKNPKAMKAGLEKIVANLLRDMGLSDNEMSFSNIRESLHMALRKKFNANTDNGPFLFIEDVYTDFCIYEFKGKLFRLGYSAADIGVTLSDEAPVEVKRVTEYRTVQGAFVGNQDTTSNPIDMNKKEVVDSIVSNAKSPWKEADRATLMAMSEDQLTAVTNALKEPASVPTANAASVPNPTAPTKADPASVQNTEKKVVTVQDYIAAAPKEVAELLTNSLQLHNEEKARLIETITANKNNVFAKADLENRPLGELRGIARLAAGDQEHSRTANYSGNAPLNPVGNQTEEALALPVMNFSKAA